MKCNRFTMLRTAARLWVTGGLLCTLPLVASAATNNIEGTVYADTGWNGTHSGPRNDDVARVDLPRGFKEAWRANPSNAFEQGIGLGFQPNGDSMVLAATGYGVGHSNLHAYDLEGNLLWQSAPWTDAGGLDSCAAVSTTIVDVDHDIYLPDCNQMWAFNPDGTVKWVVDLPAAPEEAIQKWQTTSAGNVNAIVNAFFTKDGGVGGLTLYGDIVVFDRETGAPLYEPFNLGATIGHTSTDVPATVFGGTFDPELREWYYNWIFATDAFVSADTPAIATGSGRMFMSAKGTSGGNSMYGIDFKRGDGQLGTIQVAWESPLDLTGGSSPALAPDESFVAAGTGEGYIRGFDTETGVEKWHYYNPQAAAGSVSIGPMGRVFSIPHEGIAIWGSDGVDEDGVPHKAGDVAWATRNPDGTSKLDPLVDFAGLTPNHTLGTPRVSSASIILVIGDKILQSVNVGYPLAALLGPDSEATAPVRGYLISRDRRTGELIDGIIPFAGPTTLENLTSVHKSGLVFNAYGALAASSMAQLAPHVNPILAANGEQMLPNDPQLVVSQGIDEAKIGNLVDGVIESGDFVVDFSQPKSCAISGSATINGALVEVVKKKGKHKNKCELVITDTQRGFIAELDLKKVAPGPYGEHAAVGKAEGYVFKTTDGKKKKEKEKEKVKLEFVIKDWS